VQRSATYIAGLLSVVLVLLLTPHTHQQAKGFKVLLGKSCPTDVIFENRNVVIRVLPGDALWLNDKSFDETSLRQAVSKAMESRYERLVWIAGDERVAYGSVVGIISKLTRDTPDLHVAIATKSQIGPGDPLEIEKLRAKFNGRAPVVELPCVSVY